ncbi:hypothetical protein Sjap_013288 [Stephania japonica]|uniref:Uncharacterized protein n=1 Tax=Stephania japonica TaxID=461633 RepID=A0AAP0P160_9MAGN
MTCVMQPHLPLHTPFLFLFFEQTTLTFLTRHLSLPPPFGHRCLQCRCHPPSHR